MTEIQYAMLMEDMDNAARHIIKCLEVKEKYWEVEKAYLELAIIKSLRYHFELDRKKQQFSLTKLGVTRLYHYTADYELRFGGME